MYVYSSDVILFFLFLLYNLSFIRMWATSSGTAEIVSYLFNYYFPLKHTILYILSYNFGLILYQYGSKNCIVYIHTYIHTHTYIHIHTYINAYIQYNVGVHIIHDLYLLTYLTSLLAVHTYILNSFKHLIRIIWSLVLCCRVWLQMFLLTGTRVSSTTMAHAGQGRLAQLWLQK